MEIMTTRYFYSHGIEGEEMATTLKEWDNLDSAIKYARRYAKGNRFAGVEVEVNGKVAFEITSDFEEIDHSKKKEKAMTAYDSYLSTFPPKPEYQKEVLYPWYDDKPLYTTLKERGVLVESKKLTAKILSAADGAVSFDMVDGGIAETMSDKYTGDVVLVIVPPEQVPIYKAYQAPLPYWAWCTG